MTRTTSTVRPRASFELRRAVRALGASSAVALVAGNAVAQVPDPGGRVAEQLQREQRIRELEELRLDTRQRANQSIPPGQRTLVDYGAYLQANYLTLDDAAGENHVLREYNFYPFLRLNFDGAQEIFLRGVIGYRDFHAGDSFDGRGDEPIDGDLDRGYYRIDLRRYNAAYGRAALGARPGGDFNLTFQGGRDLAYWANGLVLATPLDGVNVGVEYGAFDLDVIAGVTPVRTVDFDTSRPSFSYNTRRGFYGAMASLRAGEHRPFAYGLIQRDYNEMDALSLGPIDTAFEYNSWYLGVGSVGALGDNLRYGVEAVYEGGNSLSNSFEIQTGGGLLPLPQTRNEIQAWAVDARLDYLFNDRRQTRLQLEGIVASGDRDRGTATNTFNGNARNSKDHGFNAFGLLNTGLAFSPDVSNLMVLRAGIATVPLPDQAIFQRLQVGADVLAFGKPLRTAPIDEPTGEETYLGFEPDLYLNWQVTSDLTLALRYGLFFPSEAAFGNDDVRQFFYGGLTFSF